MNTDEEKDALDFVRFSNAADTVDGAAEVYPSIWDNLKMCKPDLLYITEWFHKYPIDLNSTSKKISSLLLPDKTIKISVQVKGWPIRDTTHKLINHLDTPTLKPGDLEIKYIHQKKDDGWLRSNPYYVNIDYTEEITDKIKYYFNKQKTLDEYMTNIFNIEELKVNDTIEQAYSKLFGRIL